MGQGFKGQGCFRQAHWQILKPIHDPRQHQQGGDSRGKTRIPGAAIADQKSKETLVAGRKLLSYH